MDVCYVCGRSLPNRWAVAKRETVGGVEKCYCALHAGDGAESGTGGAKKQAEMSVNPNERNEMKEEHGTNAPAEAQERELVRKAGDAAAKKAWAACAGVAGKAASGLKALWSKIHPDRSPAAMIESLNATLSANRARLETLKPELEKAYAAIVAKKAVWQKAPEARKRILKAELETLLARYKGLEREFNVLNENTRTVEAVKGRYLEVLAYELRGKLDEDQVDDLSGLVDEKAEEADGVQDALRDLEKAGHRKDRADTSLEDELAGFDGDLSFDDTNELETTTNETENNDENEEMDRNLDPDGLLDRDGDR